MDVFYSKIMKFYEPTSEIPKKYIDRCPACAYLFEYKTNALKKCLCGRSEADFTDLYIRILFDGSHQEYLNLISK